RLVARGLETEWEGGLRDLAAAENELRRREQHHTSRPSPDEIERLRTLGVDLRQVWTARTTTDRDRKELLRTLLEEVIISVAKTPPHAQSPSAVEGWRNHAASDSAAASRSSGFAYGRGHDGSSRSARKTILG